MTLKDLRTKANTRLADFWSKLVPKQDAYFAKHGKYFQLVITNRVVDGADTDFETKHPTDEKHQADVDFTYGTKIPFAISVDEWVIGKEAGYSATATVELPGGRRFARKRDNLNVDSGWNEVIDDLE